MKLTRELVLNRGAYFAYSLSNRYGDEIVTSSLISIKVLKSKHMKNERTGFRIIKYNESP